MNIPVFPKGARVVFAGDSNINNNRFLCHINEYYRKHVPDLSVSFFNCAIAGGTIGTLLAVFDRDIMYYNPTHIVLSIGGNDSGIVYLRQKDETTYDKLTECYERFKKNLEAFEGLCKKNGITLYFGTTLPYAEYQEGLPNVYRGGYALFKHYADTMRDFAEKGGYAYCDYHPYITRELMFKELYRNDHLHLNNLGHYYLAKCFLESQGFALDTDELSPEIVEWNAKTQAVRNIFVAMYENFCLGASLEEAKEKIQKYIDTTDATDPKTRYKLGLAKSFMRDYGSFDENREWLKNFVNK